MERKVKISRTNILLIEKINSLDLISEYAYFLQFKYTFSSSSVNKGNIKRFAEMNQLSYKTVRTKIKTLISLDWAYKRKDGSIVFKRNKDIYKQFGLPFNRWKHTMNIKIDNDVKLLKIKLASRLIEANLCRQMHVISGNSGYSSINERDDNGKDNKKSNNKTNYRKKFKQMSVVQEETSLSLSGFGRVINRSKSAGARLKKKMKELGLIATERVFKKIRTVASLEEYRDACRWLCKMSGIKYNPRYSYYNGAVCERYTDIIKIRNRRLWE